MALYTADQLKRWDVSSTAAGSSGWKPTRSLAYSCDSWLTRLKLAWGVFRGRYDALDWENH